MRASPRTYRPIDETLTDIPFLILRAARRFDWFEPGELAVALDIHSADIDHQRRNTFDVTVFEHRLQRNAS